MLALLAVVLQFDPVHTLGFGAGERRLRQRVLRLDGLRTPCSRCPCIYWIETQVATVWRRTRREGIDRLRSPRACRADDVELLRAGLEACSFFWAFYVVHGVWLFVVLYVASDAMSWHGWSIKPR